MEYIAEIGWNFMGNLQLAEKMIKDAATAGANTAKFQYWKPNKLRAGEWDNDGRRQIYESAQLGIDDLRYLINTCAANNIKFLTSVFNAEDALELSEIGIREIKIPSHEIANFELHRFCLSAFDKIYVSCGACTEYELDEVSKLYSVFSSKKDIVAMHCISSYPCPPEKTNLPRFVELKSRFDTKLGFSDHSQSTLIPALSLAYGCTVIEKHFTSDKNLPGRDNQFALLKSEFKQMVHNCEEAALANISHGTDYLDIESNTVTQYRGRWG